MRNFPKMRATSQIIAASAVIVIGYLGFGRRWLTTWGATEAEHTMKLAGDDLIKGGVFAPLNMTQAITIEAPPDKVWPWLVQIGQDRAGFYSFEKLERILGFGIYNTYRIVPEWQDLEAGDFCKFHKSGIGMKVVDLKKNSHIVMLTDSNKRAKLKSGQLELQLPESWNWYVAWNWSFNLIELPGGGTRFLVRGLAAWDPVNPVADFILDFLGGMSSCIMQMQMCKELKGLAEGTHPALQR
jgi:hypothetical protein